MALLCGLPVAQLPASRKLAVVLSISQVAMLRLMVNLEVPVAQLICAQGARRDLLRQAALSVLALATVGALNVAVVVTYMSRLEMAPARTLAAQAVLWGLSAEMQPMEMAAKYQFAVEAPQQVELETLTWHLVMVRCWTKSRRSRSVPTRSWDPAGTSLSHRDMLCPISLTAAISSFQRARRPRGTVGLYI